MRRIFHELSFSFDCGGGSAMRLSRTRSFEIARQDANRLQRAVALSREFTGRKMDAVLVIPPPVLPQDIELTVRSAEEACGRSFIAPESSETPQFWKDLEKYCAAVGFSTCLMTEDGTVMAHMSFSPDFSGFREPGTGEIGFSGYFYQLESDLGRGAIIINVGLNGSRELSPEYIGTMLAFEIGRIKLSTLYERYYPGEECLAEEIDFYANFYQYSFVSFLMRQMADRETSPEYLMLKKIELEAHHLAMSSYRNMGARKSRYLRCHTDIEGKRFSIASLLPGDVAIASRQRPLRPIFA